MRAAFAERDIVAACDELNCVWRSDAMPAVSAATLSNLDGAVLASNQIHLHREELRQAILARDRAQLVVQAYEAIDDKEGALSASRRCLARCERLLRVEPDHSGANRPT